MQTLEKLKALDLPAFCNAHGLEVFENVSLSKYSYLKTGGTARYVVYPRSVDSLVSILAHLVETGQRFKIIGNTSNLLFKDATDYSVLICTLWLNDISVLNGELVAECGASLPELSRQALYSGFRGFEGLEGIPGTVGAGIFMNAGAYGSEIKDTLLAVDFAQPDGAVRRISAAELGLDHRSSLLRKGELDGTILRAYFKGMPGNVTSIYSKMELFHEKRHRYQDFLYPNLGSLFSGSPYDVFARRDKSVRWMMKYDLWRRRFAKYFLKGTPTDRKWINAYLVKRLELSYSIQPFSDKTMNCLVNRGQGTDAMIAYIQQMQALTGGKIPLENEILEAF